MTVSSQVRSRRGTGAAPGLWQTAKVLCLSRNVYMVLQWGFTESNRHSNKVLRLPRSKYLRLPCVPMPRPFRTRATKGATQEVACACPEHAKHAPDTHFEQFLSQSAARVTRSVPGLWKVLCLARNLTNRTRCCTCLLRLKSKPMPQKVRARPSGTDCVMAQQFRNIGMRCLHIPKAWTRKESCVFIVAAVSQGRAQV